MKPVAAVKPWDVANIPGPVMAMPLDPKIAVAMIKRARRPLLIVGSRITEIELNGKKLVDYVVQLGKKGIHVIATAHVVGELMKHGCKPDAWMPLANIIDRLRDKDWVGVDGKGPYDLLIFMGIHYYFESQMLSTIKNFSPQTKTISLDREFQPNANFSFPNPNEKLWKEHLENIMTMLGK